MFPLSIATRSKTEKKGICILKAHVYYICILLIYVYYFTLKTLFVLKIFKFLSSLFTHAEKMA